MASKGGRGCSVFENDDYLTLDKLSVALERENTHGEGSFTLCFWMYLLKNNKPGIVIRQGRGEACAISPFLTIDADWKLSLHPHAILTQEGFIPASESVIVASDQSCPLEKWVHIGCEIGTNIARLHTDGIVVGEKSISFALHGDIPIEDYHPVFLLGGDGTADGGDVQAYAHHVCVLPQPSVTNHYVKSPPLELALDGSTGASDDHELEEGGDGVWSVVGGKASCRRNFALDVVLLDALGRSIHKDIELVASLVYADIGSPVEKPKDDAEAPLLTTFDGVEFPSTERPIRLVHGRASFKLKISQLSSKCDNRLFRVCFDSPSFPRYPFLRVFSRPIRCVSRNRNSRAPPTPWKRALTTMYQVDGSPIAEEKALESAQVSADGNCNGSITLSNGPKFLPAGMTPVKQPRTGEDKLTPRMNNMNTVEKTSERALPPAFSKGDALVAVMSGLKKPVNSGTISAAGGYTWLGGGNSMFPQCGSNDPKYADFKGNIPIGVEHETLKGSRQSLERDISSEKAVSDYLLFKYCLENIEGRAEILKEMSPSMRDEDLADFASRVSQCTGCHHDGYQILSGKLLLRHGQETWKDISRDQYPVPWDGLLNKVESSFMRISSTRRQFSAKDINFLQQIAGCGGTVTLEQFTRLWHWIYPVVLTVSNPQISGTWESEDPKWIDGMVTRKEAEELLKKCVGLPKPGTFLLRFASSRFWPHPDAGALIITYVAADLRIMHRLLNLDKKPSSNEETDDFIPLHDMLLAQPELSQLCSIQADDNSSS